MSDVKMKNIDFKKILNLENLVEYQESQVVSRTLLQNKGASMTLFAFDKGEAIATHTSGGDALVFLLDGKADITIGDDKFELTKGETIVMPSGIAHSLDAVEKFKMLLIVGM